MEACYTSNGTNHPKHTKSYNLKESPIETMSKADRSERVTAELESKFEEGRRELESEIRDLEKRLDELNTELKKTKSQIEEKEAIIDTKSQEIHELEREITKLRKEIKSLNNRLIDTEKNLRSEITLLKEKVGLSQKNEDKLYLCQAASMFEQAVCSYVLPEVFQDDHYATIRDLLDALNGNKDPQLDGARRKWHKICDDLKLPAEWKSRRGNWNSPYGNNLPDILKAITLLKRFRNPVAHPNPVSLAKAERIIDCNSIKPDMNPSQYEIIKRFITSLRTNMNRSGLVHDQLEFD